MKIKNLFLIPFIALSINAMSQTLYVPSGTAGIGTSTVTGNVGIGISNPSEKLHINGSIRGNQNGALRINTGYGYIDIGPINTGFAHIATDRDKFYFNKPIWINTGTISSYTNNDLLLQTAGNTRLTIASNDGKATFTGHVVIPSEKSIICGTSISHGLRLFWHEGYQTSYIDYSPGNLYFRNGSGGVMVLQNNGNVGIGFGVNYTTAGYDHTQGYKLAVNGKILCEGIDGIADVPNSDYVFEKDYDLKSLEEVESFISENKHLPEVQSAADFKENGYNMNKFDDLLLRKVEELTLYIIDQEKRIKALEAENANLKK